MKAENYLIIGGVVVGGYLLYKSKIFKTIGDVGESVGGAVAGVGNVVGEVGNAVGGVVGGVGNVVGEVGGVVKDVLGVGSSIVGGVGGVVGDVRSGVENVVGVITKTSDKLINGKKNKQAEEVEKFDKQIETTENIIFLNPTASEQNKLIQKGSFKDPSSSSVYLNPSKSQIEFLTKNVTTFPTIYL